MPAKSKKQQKVMAIAMVHPEKLYKRNRKLKKLTKEQLHEFAATRTKELPERIKNKETKGSKKKRQ